MTDIYLAQIFCEPIFFVSHLDQQKQLVAEAKLSFSQEECQKWVESKKGQYRVKKSRVAKLNWKKVKSVYLYSDRRELSITVEIPGGIMQDFKPKTIFFSVYGDKLTPEMEKLAQSFMWKAEAKRQREWRKQQKKRK